MEIVAFLEGASGDVDRPTLGRVEIEHRRVKATRVSSCGIGAEILKQGINKFSIDGGILISIIGNCSQNNTLWTFEVCDVSIVTDDCSSSNIEGRESHLRCERVEDVHSIQTQHSGI